MNKQPKYKIDNAKLSRQVAKAQNGNTKAMEDVINMVSGYLYYYSLTLLGNEEDAKDAVQDILLTVLKKLDTLENPKAFLGWLKTIAANYCKTKLTRSRENLSLSEVEWDLADENDQLCPERSAETGEVCGYVREAVRALPQILRESVLMFYFYQMSIRQIADVLEVNENTVKSRLYSARQTMKKYLEQYGCAALASCSVPPMSLLSFSLIQGAEMQKAILIPYATPAGAVKVAAVNSAASGGVTSVKIAAIGAACVAVIGGIGAAASGAFTAANHASPAKPSYGYHRSAGQPENREQNVPTTVQFTDVPPTARNISGNSGSNVNQSTAPTQARIQATQPVVQAQQNTSQTNPSQSPTSTQAAQATNPPATAATSATVTPATTVPVTVPAERRKVYIDASGFVGDFGQIFCHIYDSTSSFYEWASKKEYCTLDSGTLYSFDLNPLNLEDGKTYYVMFGTTTGSQTEALEFSTADYGAVMLVEPDPTKAHVDNPQMTYYAKWK